MVAVHRRGTTLVELLAALPLIALLVVVIALLTLDSQRTSRTVDGSTTRMREIRHASATIAALLRPLRSTDVHKWTDTLIEFDAHIAFGVVCGQSASNRIDLLPANSTDALGTSWTSAPAPGTDIELQLAADDATALPVVHRATVTDVGTTSTGCNSSTLKQSVGGSAVRLTIAPAPPSAATIGGAVQLLERTRISLYRSGNEWFVGLKRFTPSGWETVQPIAGPFASASDNGMRITLLGRDGATLPPHLASIAPDPDVQPTSIQLFLRARSAWTRANGVRDHDSLTTTIALRHP